MNPSLTVKELLQYVCEKRNLDPATHFFDLPATEESLAGKTLEQLKINNIKVVLKGEKRGGRGEGGAELRGNERKRRWEKEGVKLCEIMSSSAESPTQKRKTSIKNKNKVSEKPADSPKVRGEGRQREGWEVGDSWAITWK